VLSLSCATRQKVVNLALVEEVISDLDISQHVTEVAPSRPYDFEELATMMAGNPSQARMATAGASSSPAGSHMDSLSPAEARAYMQQLSGQLKDWQQNLDRGGARRSSVRGKHE